MTNHYHLLLETLQPTFSKGMREVKGVYTQALNRRHDRVGDVPSQGVIGNESFVESTLDRFDQGGFPSETPKQSRPARSLARIAEDAPERDQAVVPAWKTGAYTLTEIAGYFGLYPSTASRIARKAQDA